MADVFISYASKDRERAHKMASSLEARGLTVWWDRKLIVGQSYDQVIEQELEIAKSVVVLWSEEAINSEWVKNEAAVAAERGILVPARIDNIKLPLEFRRRQTADLISWDGDPSHSGFLALCDGIALKTGNANKTANANETANINRTTNAATVLPPPPQQSVHPAPPAPRRTSPLTSPLILGAVALIALASVAGVYWGLTRTTQPSIQPSISNEAEKPRVTEQPSISDEAEKPGATGPVGIAGESVEIADVIAGTYYGDVVADSQGSSRTDVTVTITRVGTRKVRITSDYGRLGDAEMELTKDGNVIHGSGGESILSLDMDQTPPRLGYNPGGVSYVGQKR